MLRDHQKRKEKMMSILCFLLFSCLLLSFRRLLLLANTSIGVSDLNIELGGSVQDLFTCLERDGVTCEVRIRK